MHHVNLTVPEDAADAEADWLIDLLGYQRAVPGPDAEKLGTLRWFQGDDGHQVHLSIDADHAPSKRAHTAIRLDGALDDVVARLEAKGESPRAITFDGDRHVFTTDPAGNLWELIGPPVD
jgi:catechol 2,3-dioxygenase-like lactoylglutathione lyase family enzyme